MPDFDEMMVREAFARVKQDILALRAEAERNAERIESLLASLPNYPDKKEFYEFISHLRTELDTLATRADIARTGETIAQLKHAADQKSKELAELSSRMNAIDKTKASTEELRTHSQSNEKVYAQLRAELSDLRSKSATSERVKRIEEWHAKEYKGLETRVARDITTAEERAKKSIAAIESKSTAADEKLSKELAEMRSEIATLSGANERLKEGLAQLRIDARNKERQIERLKEKVSGRRVKAEEKRRPVSVGPILLIIAIIALVAILIFAVPSFTPVGANETNAQQDACIAQFECYDLGGEQFYGNCNYNETLGNCRCDIVSNISMCDAEGRDAAARRIESSGSTPLWPWAVIIGAAALLFALFLLSRRRAQA